MHPSSRPSVLIVDDDVAAREALAEALEPLACEVIQAGRSSVAESHLRDRAFDVVVLEVELPGGTGFSLAERLRAEGHLGSAQLVFLTRLEVTDDLIARALALGCSDFVQKPVPDAIFRARVRVLLQLAQTT